jgi:ubiquinone/menaquinone biosynthesis C-methylase UbiE
MSDPDEMKRDWDALARANARYHIATTAWRTDAEFESSGARDALLFFSGIEELLRPDAVALDLGCGIGRMDRYLAPRLKRLIGLDVSGEMVRLARQRLASLPNVEFVEGDGRSLRPIGDASVDLVFSYLTFQHLPDRVLFDYLHESRRVLRDGGRFVFQIVDSPRPLAAREPVSWFETRFHGEAVVRRQLDAAGFTVRGSVRHTIETESMPCDYVRLDAVRS